MQVESLPHVPARPGAVNSLSDYLCFGRALGRGLARSELSACQDTQPCIAYMVRSLAERVMARSYVDESWHVDSVDECNAAALAGEPWD